MRTAFVALRVLRSEVKESPSPVGSLLYYALAEHCRIVLTADDNASAKLVDEHWLSVYGFSAHQLVSYSSEYENIKPSRFRQIRRLQNSGFGGEILAVETNPEIVEELLYNGIPAMLVVEPEYFSPQYRPDYSSDRKSWDQLVEEIDRQKILKANDARVNPEVM